MDTSYNFSFVIPHTDEKLKLKFSTLWPKEDKNSPQSYRVRNLKVEPVGTLVKPTEKEIAAARSAMFCYDGKAAMKAWSEVFVRDLKAFQQLGYDVYCPGPRSRRLRELIDKLDEGLFPSMALYQEDIPEGYNLTANEAREMAVLILLTKTPILKKLENF